VLDRMQVQYRETKGGFECIHLPSIDLSSVEPTIKGHRHGQQTSSTSGETSTVTPVPSRPSIVKKASKLSFGMKRDKGKEREPSMDKEKEKESAGRPSGATLMTTASSGSSSFFNVSSNHTVVAASPEIQPSMMNGLTPVSPTTEREMLPPGSPSPGTPGIANKGKVLPPIPRDFGGGATSPVPPRSPSPMPTGEIDRELFESMGNNSLSVRFEINIVKVCFLKSTLISRLFKFSSSFRYLGCRFMVFSSDAQVEMVGNTKC